MSSSTSQGLDAEQIRRALREEMIRLHGLYLRQHRDHPKQVAQNLERLHQDREGVFRYAYIDSLRQILFSDKDRSVTGFFHTVCINGLPNSVLKIILDPRVYAWEEDAPYYHPDLEQYINCIYSSFYSCCRYMASVPWETYGAPYKEICRHILNETYRLWPFLWQNRHRLFDPNKKQRPLQAIDESNDRLRGGVALLLGQIIPLYLRLHDYVVPPLSYGMVDVLLYCWQYHKQLWLSELGTQCLALVLEKSPVAECKAALSKVITDEATASRICRHMCRDLEHRKFLDDSLHEYLVLLNILLRNSPAFAEARVGRVDFVRAVAAGCQRQLCSGKECDEYDSLVLEEGFKVMHTLTKGHGPGMRDDIDSLCNPATAGIIVYAASSIVIPAAEAGDTALLRSIATILGMYGEATSSVDWDSSSLGTKDLSMRATLHRHWFRTMQKFRVLNIQRNDRRYPALEIWRNFGRQLGFRSNGRNPDAEFVSEEMKRCNWHKCLCHENRALHRLRVCKGCWRVLYCSSECQRKDWNKGGHRARCTKGN